MRPPRSLRAPRRRPTTATDQLAAPRIASSGTTGASGTIGQGQSGDAAAAASGEDESAAGTAPRPAHRPARTAA